MTSLKPVAIVVLALWTQPATAQSIQGDCSLTVDGKTYLDIQRTCRISLSRDGSFSINTRETLSKTDESFYFAYLSKVDGEETAWLYWNEDPQTMHAHTALGDDFRRRGACWIGRRAKVCAYKR